jgi:KamA family protein
MIPYATIKPRRYKAYTRENIDRIPQLRYLTPDQVLGMKAVSAVFPFRVNSYVTDQLIHWDRVPEDPIYQLFFPHHGMLDERSLARMISLVRKNAPHEAIQHAARRIQTRLNPHPAGQMELNVPFFNDRPLPGFQHKYRETVLFFPSRGQTCHAYCTYCFRWAQFAGIDELKFASREAETLAAYLRQHTEVRSVLFTGGDPLIMKARVLRRYVEPLLKPGLEHVASIRIGTKAVASWPYRFLTDSDADDLLRLFEEVRGAGRHLALMAHYSHPRELETAEAQAAIRRILDTGSVIRSQAPLVKHVNDDATVWADMWALQVRLGVVPYYMFVERNTGPKNYFEVPLARAADIFRTAVRRVTGLGRTVRGPSMSATPGKVNVEGVTTVDGEKVFVLKFLQARDPDWVGRLFFARFDSHATWLNHLLPAFGESEFFYEPELRQIKRTHRQAAWGDRVPRRRKLVLFGHVEWE